MQAENIDASIKGRVFCAKDSRFSCYFKIPFRLINTFYCLLSCLKPQIILSLAFIFYRYVLFPLSHYHPDKCIREAAQINQSPTYLLLIFLHFFFFEFQIHFLLKKCEDLENDKFFDEIC